MIGILERLSNVPFVSGAHSMAQLTNLIKKTPYKRGLFKKTIKIRCVLSFLDFIKAYKQSEILT